MRLKAIRRKRHFLSAPRLQGSFRNPDTPEIVRRYRPRSREYAHAYMLVESFAAIRDYLETFATSHIDSSIVPS